MDEWTQVHTNTLALLGIDEKKKGFRKPDDIADSYFVMWKTRDLSCGWLHIRLCRLYIITRQELNTPKNKIWDYELFSKNRKRPRRMRHRVQPPTSRPSNQFPGANETVRSTRTKRESTCCSSFFKRAGSHQKEKEKKRVTRNRSKAKHKKEKKKNPNELEINARRNERTNTKEGKRQRRVIMENGFAGDDEIGRALLCIHAWYIQVGEETRASGELACTARVFSNSSSQCGDNKRETLRPDSRLQPPPLLLENVRACLNCEMFFPSLSRPCFSSSVSPPVRRNTDREKTTHGEKNLMANSEG